MFIILRTLLTRFTAALFFRFTARLTLLIVLFCLVTWLDFSREVLLGICYIICNILYFTCFVILGFFILILFILTPGLICFSLNSTDLKLISLGRFLILIPAILLFQSLLFLVNWQFYLILTHLCFKLLKKILLNLIFTKISKILSFIIKMVIYPK